MAAAPTRKASDILQKQTAASRRTWASRLIIAKSPCELAMPQGQHADTQLLDRYDSPTSVLFRRVVLKHS